MSLHTEAVDWALDLGGGVRIALIQAGTFRSDAGVLLGLVPRRTWEPLVRDELDALGRLRQALNCLLIEVPAGRVLVETGLGERLDDRTREARGVEGTPILPALRSAGFSPETVDVVAVSHLHFDHAGGLLAGDGRPAFPNASIVAQHAEWEIALDLNPRIVVSYDQPELRLVRPLAIGTAARGEVEMMPGVSVVPTGGHTAGHQGVIIRGTRRTAAFFGDLCMRPWSADPRWLPAFDDFPLTSVEVKERLFARAVAERWTVILSHESRRPIGRLKRNRAGYSYVSS